jgi:peptide/nickel transport system substrate-binding protein
MKWMIAAVLLAVAEGMSVLAAQAETPKDTLVIAKNIDDIVSLDPAEAYEPTGGEILNNTYERIFTYDPSDFTKLIGGVAESWSVSDDGKTVTIKIRPGLKFASGHAALTARDAAFSLQRVVILGKTPVFILTQLGWSKDNVKEKVTATDDATLVLKLSDSFAPSFVLNVLSSSVASVVDSAEVLAHQSGDDLGYGWLKANSAGSGAYKLVTFKPNEAAVFEANPGHAAPGLKRVILRHVPDKGAQQLLIEKGDVDVARDLSTDQLKAIASDPKLTISSVLKTNIYYFGLNQTYGPLKAAKVQEALRWLIDYQGLVATAVKGQFDVQQGFWGQGVAGSWKETPYHLDVAKAKALLTEAGYPNGFEVELDAYNTSPYAEVAQSVQATFAQVGVKVKLVLADKKQVLTKYRSRSHQIVFNLWSPDYLDIHSSADWFAHNTDVSDTSQNRNAAWRNNWASPELAKQTDAALKERDPEKRLLAYASIQKSIATNSPFIVGFQQTEQAVSGAQIKGFILGPSWDTPVWWRAVK